MLIVNTELGEKSISRDWSTTLVFSSAKYLLKHVTRTQVCQNISEKYGSRNELFPLFLDETMSYSCAYFKTPDEDLKNAQLRKIHMLIEKARISKNHHVLEIGCGWGSLAVEVVVHTGCKYTGITSSKEQLQHAKQKAKEASLQDRITFLLCDYRHLPEGCKYDRIIACESLEAVGDECMEAFFECCDSALAENGVFVLQFTSMTDEKYEEFRFSQGFMKECKFSAGCLPSLRRVTSAMATASRLSVVHSEDIGSHYYRTLRCWRENFLKNQSKIMALRYDDKFIRSWEYYVDYFAAGFKLRILGDFQVVLTRPRDTVVSAHKPRLP